ncbi:MAG: S9 family peptidase [Acidobacteriaceae bacterium]|nr:S9 family peptidase [Acidobacteriaceae bacterium]
MCFIRFTSIALGLFLILPVWAAKQPITETDLLKIQRITEVQLTPDGAFAVYGVQSVHTEPPATPNTDPTYSYRVNLWMIDLRDPSAKPMQLTFGDRNDSNLAISPDGRQLAFVRADKADKRDQPASEPKPQNKQEKPHPQVWVMSLRNPGEPRMVTHLEFGATAPRWRDDSKALLVSSPIAISKLPGKPEFDLERPGRDWWDFDRPEPAESGHPDQKENAKFTGRPDGNLRAIRDWLEHNSENNDPVDITRIAFLGELNLNEEMTVDELFRVDLDSEEKATQLTRSYNDHQQAVFSPAGDRILFASRPPTHQHPDRLEDRSAIWEMDADGSNEHVLINDEHYSFRNPKFSKDGKYLVVVGQQNDQPTYRQTMLARCDPDGSHLTWLTKDGDPSVQQPEISADGRVYYTVDYHGGQPLRSVDLKTSEAAEIVSGPVGVSAFAVAPGKIVYAQISAENPNELYLASATDRSSSRHPAARRLTEINAAWLEDRILSLPEEHWLTRPDGLRIQYWVMKPAHVEPGKQYPWVLDMHGGPSAMWGPGEFTMWHEFQMFCSFGYGVVYANPRGSGGYGYPFQHANYQNWGEAPMGDVMAALDDSISRYPMIDKDRLFLAGGSYAGYLAAWIVGHTNRFKAAAAERGVYDLSTFFGEGNAYRLVPEEFGGYPWDPETRRVLDQQSPITYVKSITTPLLILHGSQDNRTGVTQSQMLFRALKQLNRPVEYVRYPGIGHELTRSGPPHQRMDHMLRIIEFFERYSGNNRPAPETTAGATQ